MTDAKIVVAIAGGAPTTEKNVADLLSDYFRIDQDDEREFKLIVPVAEALVTDAVKHAVAWVVDIDGTYTAIHTEPIPRKLRPMVNDADEAIVSDNVADDLITELVNARNKGDEVVLMLAWGEDVENGPDEDTRELLDMAFDEKIQILDISMGLAPLDFTEEDEEPEDEPAEEPEDEPEPPKKATRELKAEARELTEDDDAEDAADEAQAAVPAEIPAADVAADMPDLITTLGFVAQLLDFQDRANAANQMQPAYQRPLTRAVRHHLARLLAESGPTVAATVVAPEAEEEKPRRRRSEPVQEPLPESEEEKPTRRRGKPRDTASDILTVYVIEKDKKIKIAGRGRAPKGSEKREMTREEYFTLLKNDYIEF